MKLNKHVVLVLFNTFLGFFLLITLWVFFSGLSGRGWDNQVVPTYIRVVGIAAGVVYLLLFIVINYFFIRKKPLYWIIYFCLLLLSAALYPFSQQIQTIVDTFYNSIL